MWFSFWFSVWNDNKLNGGVQMTTEKTNEGIFPEWLEKEIDKLSSEEIEG